MLSSLRINSEQQNRRVLRARGISSYTEQFYSDDEIEEKELDEWADVEAIYAAPSTQVGAPTAYFAPKIKQPVDQNNEEDSDQDWILPSSRKRKNKRPCEYLNVNRPETQWFKDIPLKYI